MEISLFFALISLVAAGVSIYFAAESYKCSMILRDRMKLLEDYIDILGEPRSYNPTVRYADGSVRYMQ